MRRASIAGSFALAYEGRARPGSRMTRWRRREGSTHVKRDRGLCHDFRPLGLYFTELDYLDLGRVCVVSVVSIVESC